MHQATPRAAALLLASIWLHPAAQAQTVLAVDATAPVPQPETGYLKLGSNVAPDAPGWMSTTAT